MMKTFQKIWATFVISRHKWLFILIHGKIRVIRILRSHVFRCKMSTNFQLSNYFVKNEKNRQNIIRECSIVIIPEKYKKIQFTFSFSTPALSLINTSFSSSTINLRRTPDRTVISVSYTHLTLPTIYSV